MPSARLAPVGQPGNHSTPMDATLNTISARMRFSKAPRTVRTQQEQFRDARTEAVTAESPAEPLPRSSAGDQFDFALQSRPVC